LSSSAGQLAASTTAVDAAAAKLAAPTVVAELDLGKLKGDLRRLAWSEDGSQFCIQTVDGVPPNDKVRNYVVAAAGGAVTPVDPAPAWADKYWAMKSDRVSSTDPSVIIDVEQGHETLKYGTGSAGAIDQQDRVSGGVTTSGANVDRAALSERRNVVRLTVLGETISEFVDERPVPGLMFGWGPPGSAILAYTDREGHLMLLDLRKHKQVVAGVRDAMLPAWSPDATRLAYVRKSGRRKFTLVSSTVQY
jgi:hypothetical protein